MRSPTRCRTQAQMLTRLMKMVTTVIITITMAQHPRRPQRLNQNYLTRAVCSKAWQCGHVVLAHPDEINLLERFIAVHVWPLRCAEEEVWLGENLHSKKNVS